MASGGVLQELTILLGYETDEASKQKAEAGVSRLKQGLEGLASLAFGETLRRGLTELTLGAIDAGSEINDLSERLGVSTRAIQEFTYAASLSGGSAEDAANGMRNLGRLASEAAGGSKEAAKAFADLGVRATDAAGKARPIEELLPEIADGFSKLEEGPERVAAAMTLLGRSGADLIPVLSQGSKGLEDVYKEAERLGLIVDQNTIGALDAAGDEIGAFKSGLESLKLQFGGQLAPLFERVFRRLRTEFTPRLVDLVKHTNLAKYAIGALSVATGLLFGRGLLHGLKFLGFVKDTNMSLGGMVGSLLKFGPIVGAIGALALVFEDLYTWISGGDSVAGELFTKFLGAQGAADLLTSLQTAFAGIQEAVAALVPIVGDLVTLLVKGFAAALPYVVKLLDFVLSLVAAVTDAFGTLIKVGASLGKLIGGGKGSDFVDEVDKAFLANKSGKTIDASAKRVLGLGNYSETVSQPFIDDPSAARKAVMNGDTTNTVQQTNQITINVPTGDVGRGIAGALKGALGDSNQAALAALGGQ